MGKTKRSRKASRQDIFTTLALSLVIAGVVALVTYLVTPKGQQQAISGAHGYMLNAQEEDGHFVYELNAYTSEHTKDDNIVRQAGAVYILGEYFKQYPQGDTLAAIERALAYLSQYTDYEERENGEVAYIRYRSAAKLGAVALASMACESVRETAIWSDSLARQCDGYKRLMDFQANEEGLWSDRYFWGVPRNDFRFDTRSPYADGEALLALSQQLAQNPTSEELKAELDKHINYVIIYYGNALEMASTSQEKANEVVGFYLWGLRALDTLHEVDKQEKYGEIAYRLTNWLIDEKRLADADYQDRATALMRAGLSS